MKAPINMPKLGMHMTDGTIVEWAVADSDEVAEGDVVVTIETDKVTEQLLAPSTGRVRIVVADGETVDVGTVLGYVAETGADLEDPPVPAAPSPRDVAAVEPPPVASAPPEGRRPSASPRARRLAAEQRIDLSAVLGTGPDGLVTEADVQAVADAPAVRSGAAGGGPMKSVRSREPLSAMRRAIARNLMENVQTTAQATSFFELDARSLATMREQPQPNGARVGISTVLVAAITRALVERPQLNSTLDGNEMVLWEEVNIGVAVATPTGGLVVPVVPDCASKSLLELESLIQDKVARARAGALGASDLSGGTFTYSNLGSLPGAERWRAATPILNGTESAILAVGRARDVVEAQDGQAVIVSKVPMSLTHDHRIHDGEAAITFMTALQAALDSMALAAIQGQEE